MNRRPSILAVTLSAALLLAVVGTLAADPDVPTVPARWAFHRVSAFAGALLAGGTAQLFVTALVALVALLAALVGNGPARRSAGRRLRRRAR